MSRYTTFESDHTSHFPGCGCDKRRLFSTAYVKGLNQCCVGLRRFNPATGMFLCLMPFGNERWIHENELERFVL